MGELSKLKGLGPKSEKYLNQVGIFTRDDLEEIGPVRAFIRLKQAKEINPSLNFLYAMVGALQDEHWADIARTEKGRLLMELEGFRELEAMLAHEGIKLDY